MENLKEFYLPQHGVISQVAKLAGVSRTTAMHAIRHGTHGKKSELCRKIFREQCNKELNNND